MIDPSMEAIDDASFRPAQLMYRPSVCADGEFVFEHNTGELVDAGTILKEVGDCAKDYARLPHARGRQRPRLVAQEAEDPRTKSGLVGAFCRTFTVPEAISEFLADVYVDPIEIGGETRYTHAGGEGVNGAIICGDGSFLYSHHANSDPAAGRLLNAYDLVRLHRFGKLDAAVDVETAPVGSWPSIRAMNAWIDTLTEVRAQIVEDLYPEDADTPEHPSSDTGPVETKPREDTQPLADGLPPPLPRPPGEPQEDWFPNLMAFDGAGNSRGTQPNIRTILQNDPRFRGRIAFNLLRNDPVLLRDLNPGISGLPNLAVADTRGGDLWVDLHDIYLRDILLAPLGSKPGIGGYGLRSAAREDVRDAVRVVAEQWRFHPVRDYLEALPAWDGRNRSLFTDYVRTEDNAYYREAGALFLMAAVARVCNPGQEWQHVPILVGPQGCGKSTFLKSLFGETWSGELTVDLKSNADSMAHMEGYWALEFPEIANFRRAESEDAKSFITATKDKGRKPYAKRPEEHLRQCVFLGTTNEKRFLKDPTGNRRYWPIVVGDGMIDNPGLITDRDQIWAQALHAYREACRSFGYRRVKLRLSSEADAIAKQLQGRHEEEMSERVIAGRLQMWLETPRPAEQFDLSAPDRDRARRAEEHLDGDDIPPLWAVPTKVCIALIEDQAGLTLRESEALRPRRIGRAMDGLDGWAPTENPLHFKGYGKTRGWRRQGATDKELRQGYKLVPAPVE